MARFLPDDQYVCLLESLRIHRRLDDALVEVQLQVSSETELSRLQSVRKEPWTARWIEEFVRPGEVLYDIGANVGAYALLAALLTKRQARVYAFEPAFANYAALCRNIVLNDCADCITPLPLPLAQRSGWVQFNYRSLEAGKALHSMNEQRPGKPHDKAHSRPAYEQSMLALQLDELCERFEAPSPTHIKLDVDGAELAVLQGAARVLRSPGLKSVLVELADSVLGSVEDISKCLEAHGLRWHDRYAHPEAGRPQYGLFVRD